MPRTRRCARRPQRRTTRQSDMTRAGALSDPKFCNAGTRSTHRGQIRHSTVSRADITSTRSTSTYDSSPPGQDVKPTGPTAPNRPYARWWSRSMTLVVSPTRRAGPQPQPRSNHPLIALAVGPGNRPPIPPPLARVSSGHAGAGAWPGSPRRECPTFLDRTHPRPDGHLPGRPHRHSEYRADHRAGTTRELRPDHDWAHLRSLRHGTISGPAQR